MVTKEKIPLIQLSAHLEKDYAELEMVGLDTAKNKEVRERSNAEVDAVLAKNKTTLDEIIICTLIKKTLAASRTFDGRPDKDHQFYQEP